MNLVDPRLLNPWYSEQAFVWASANDPAGSTVLAWSEAVKNNLGMSRGAMTWEVHATVNGLPMLVYHDLAVYEIPGRKLFWIYTGVEPKRAPFGHNGFYDDMQVGFQDLRAAFDHFFSGIPVASEQIFLRYRYLTHDVESETTISDKVKAVADLLGRAPVPDILVPCGRDEFIPIECKMWASANQVAKDLRQVAKYIGPKNACAFLVYCVQGPPKEPLMRIELPRRNIGHDSVCSTSDAVVDVDVPDQARKVPVAVLFCRKTYGTHSKRAIRRCRR